MQVLKLTEQPVSSMQTAAIIHFTLNSSHGLDRTTGSTLQEEWVNRKWSRERHTLVKATSRSISMFVVMVSLWSKLASQSQRWLEIFHVCIHGSDCNNLSACNVHDELLIIFKVYCRNKRNLDPLKITHYPVAAWNIETLSMLMWYIERRGAIQMYTLVEKSMVHTCTYLKHPCTRQQKTWPVQSLDHEGSIETRLKGSSDISWTEHVKEWL